VLAFYVQVTDHTTYNKVIAKVIAMYRFMGFPSVFNKRVQVWSLLGMLLGSLVLSGCGQKGPLRLPPPPPEQNKPSQNDTLPPATPQLSADEQIR
jgi:predicted small lipoprotein YifL